MADKTGVMGSEMKRSVSTARVNYIVDRNALLHAFLSQPDAHYSDDV